MGTAVSTSEKKKNETTYETETGDQGLVQSPISNLQSPVYYLLWVPKNGTISTTSLIITSQFSYCVNKGTSASGTALANDV